MIDIIFYVDLLQIGFAGIAVGAAMVSEYMGFP